MADNALIGANNCIVLSSLEKDIATRKLMKKQMSQTHSQRAFEVVQDREELFRRIPYDLRVAVYQKYVNQSALHKLRSGFDTSMSLNELRQVTTLFIKVGDIKFENLSELEETQTAVTIVQKAMTKFEGSLRQFNVDDKGAVLLACFGLPPLAHENDAMYGVNAAMEIAKSFALFQEFSIGVSTGVISISGIGHTGRTEYALVFARGGAVY